MRNAPGQALGNRGFSNPRLTHQQGVVFAAAAQNLDDPLYLVLATNQGIDLSILGHLVEVLGVLLQRRGFFIFLGRSFFALGSRLIGLAGLRRVILFDAVGDEIHHIQAGHALLVEVVDRVRIFLTEDGHQHVRAHHLFFAAARGLHVHDGALNHTLKSQGRLGIHVIRSRNLRRVVLDEMGQGFAQIIDLRGARAQDLGCTGVIQQSQQQMLDRNELVPLLARLHKGHVQTDF